MYISSGSENGSEQTRPLRSSSQEPSEPSTPGFDTPSTPRVPPPVEFATTDHVITIEPDTPTRNLYMTQKESSSLQKPITPTPSIHSQSEQILSASSLEQELSKMTETPTSTVTVTPDSSEEIPPRSRSSMSTPRSSRVTPAASPSYGKDRGKSMATGKIVSGWL